MHRYNGIFVYINLLLFENEVKVANKSQIYCVQYKQKKMLSAKKNFVLNDYEMHNKLFKEIVYNSNVRCINYSFDTKNHF